MLAAVPCTPTALPCGTQYGRLMPRLVPGIAPGKPLSELFTMRHPLMAEMTWQSLQREADNSFLLKVRAHNAHLIGLSNTSMWVCSVFPAST
jgi:hypothetical protein